ncbi:MAG: hypothetical protein WAN60_00280, partial [Candidatus Sulfotelmatobacter sp.]
MNCVDLQRSLAGVEDLSTIGHTAGQTAGQTAEHTEELQAHLKSCAACSALVAELDLIASSAPELRAAEEPSPRIWNSIESALRREGLIRPQTIRPFVVSKIVVSKTVVSRPVVSKPLAPTVPSRAVSSRGVPSRDIAAAASRGFSSFAAGWGWRGWLVPAAAVMLIAVGFFVNQRSLLHQLTQHIAPAAASVPAAGSSAGWNLAGLNDDDLLQEIKSQSPELRSQYVDNLRNANDYIRDAQSVVDANPNDEESRRSLLEAYQQKA